VIYSVAAWCEECGFRNLLERLYPAGAKVYLICIECEAPLTVTVEIPKTADQLFERARA
jgi:hypothetical protein